MKPLSPAHDELRLPSLAALLAFLALLAHPGVQFAVRAETTNSCGAPRAIAL